MGSMSPRSSLPALAAACAVLVVAVPTAADAARPASDQERAGMASGAGMDPACVTAIVSTVDSSWGRVEPANPPPAQCNVGNGFALMHLEGSGWRNVGEASEPEPCG